jgi:hypothetical protein
MARETMLDEHWIARGRDGELGLYFNEPVFTGIFWSDGNPLIEIDPESFPIIKPGECRHYVETENDNA